MGEAKRKRMMVKALEVIRESLWALLAIHAERMNCERGDMLALLLEHGMLGGGFTEPEADRFIARLEQIDQAFEEYRETHPPPAAPQGQIEQGAERPGPVLPPLPGVPPIDPTEIGRLALRNQDDHWVAYYAMPDTMEGAVELGRIAFRLVEREDRRQGFMDLMRDIVADLIEERIGVRPIWPHPPRPAPRAH
jgi:hypothetical protein